MKTMKELQESGRFFGRPTNLQTKKKERSLPKVKKKKKKFEGDGGTFVYKLLTTIGGIPTTRCPRLYDLKSLDTYPAEWWVENIDMLLKAMNRQATTNFDVEFNESFCQRILKIGIKRQLRVKKL